jgi:hypothetical protein
MAYGVGARRLWTTGLSGDDNLVNRQDCPGCLCGKLDSPLLGHQQVQDALLLSIKSAGVVLVLLGCQ